MSWGFTFQATNTAAALRAVKDVAITGSQFPDRIREATETMINEISATMAPTGKVLSVDSNGHIDSWGGGATIHVRIVSAPLE